MSIHRYEPWDLFKQIYKDLSQLDPNATTGDHSTVATSNWVPSVDIREQEDRFLIEADVPGVDPSTIDVFMENGVLTIKGERQLYNKEDRPQYKRVERVHGSFYRRFSLPETADPEHITAAEKHGVLTITIPKKPVAQPKKIAVNVH